MAWCGGKGWWVFGSKKYMSLNLALLQTSCATFNKLFDLSEPPLCHPTPCYLPSGFEVSEVPFYGYFLSWLLPILCWKPRKIVLCFLAPSGDELHIVLYLCVCVCVCVRARVCVHSTTQSCPTLCCPMDCSLPGSSVHGIFQARILENVAIFPSKGSSQPKDWTCISCIGRQILYHWPPVK